MQHQSSAPVITREVCIHTWFPEPIPRPREISQWSGSIRIWGRRSESNNTNRWWRSSSIVQRIAPSTLVTRYGTKVVLLGLMYIPYASKLTLSKETLFAFKDGFPQDWYQQISKQKHQFYQPQNPFPVLFDQEKRMVPYEDEDKATSERLGTTVITHPSSGTYTAVECSQPRRVLRSHTNGDTRSEPKLSSEASMDEKPLVRKTPRRSSRLSRKKMDSIENISGMTSRYRKKSNKPSKPKETVSKDNRTQIGSKGRPNLKRKQAYRPGPGAKRKLRSSVATMPLDTDRQAQNKIPVKDAVSDEKDENIVPESALTSEYMPEGGSTPKHNSRFPDSIGACGLELSGLGDVCNVAVNGKENCSKVSAISKRTANTGTAKRSRKRVAFKPLAENQATPSNEQECPDIDRNTHISVGWSQEQREQFEQQRVRVPASTPSYWEQVADGVVGKNAIECRSLWLSSWTSPSRKEQSKSILGSSGTDLDSTPMANVATPEVVMHVRKANLHKQRRETAKYRNNVRRLAEVVARDTADDALEPDIVTPNALPGAASILSRAALLETQLGGEDGTPGTEVRLRRAEAERQGELETPELLARGKTLGFKESDHYVALFKRRTGTATICAPQFPTSPQKKVSRPRIRIKKSVNF